MADLQDNLAGLRGLYQDLSTNPNGSIATIERLCAELEIHIQDFRNLLDKAAKNNASRQKVLSGTINIDGVDYSVNQDFQQGALQVADALNIDEVEAAKMFLVAQDDSKVLDRLPDITAIMRFHERRHFLLECLRLLLREYTLDDLDEELENHFRTVVAEALALILETKDGQWRNASLFARKALGSMGDIERWLVLLNNQVQKASILGQNDNPDIMEAIEYQCRSLQQQHESLGAILYYLFKGSWLSSEDLRVMVGHLKELERFDGLLIDYLPATIVSFARYGSPAGNPGLSHTESRGLHTLITTAQDGKSWKLPDFHAATNALWLSFYSGWYFEDGSSSPGPRGNPEKEAQENTKSFMSFLNDGALDFLLAICSSVNSEEWADPARSALVALLLRDSVISLPDSWSCNDYMKQLLMENFGTFVEACIENMPDAIRMLKSEEDTQRLDQLTAMRDGLTSGPHRGPIEVRTHLESFLMIISFAFEQRPSAAQAFWDDPDTNLFGFLQWASKRQTVPRVSAFCEMLCSISEGEENATAAHRFLTDEEKSLSSKLRRSTTMSWNQMFAELQLYGSRIAGKASTASTHQSLRSARKTDPVDMNEPESPVMLTCYLRLMGHLCKQSKAVREWMWQNTSFHVINSLLELCSEPTPTHVRATVFSTLSALLTDKTSLNGNELWYTLGQWMSGASLKSTEIGKVPLVSNPSAWHEQQTFERIGVSLDQTDAFVALVKSLTTPVPVMADDIPLGLSFPSNLGIGHRAPGIEPYIDFIMGHAFTRKFQDPSGHQSRFLTFNCLDFIVMCLRSFNEDLVTVFSQPSVGPEPAVTVPDITNYVRLHPFARVMEWLFSDDVLSTLFSISQQNVNDVAQASSDSVLVLTLLRSLEAMNLVMDLQSTYFNIAKPLVRAHAGANRTPIPNSWLASFEDAVLNNLTLVSALCLYCGTGHEQLTVTSMALLEKLTSSTKLNKMPSRQQTKWQPSNIIVEALASEVDVDSITRSLVTQMEPEPRELEWGPQSAGYVVRESLLALLNRCLGMITDRPTVAHLLLGFRCVGNILDVSSDSLLANEMSLLHAIVGFLQTYPDEFDGTMTSWMLHLKRVAFEVLSHLWSSKLASYFTLAEMRAQGFLVSMFAGQPLIGPGTCWDGFPIVSDDFWLSDGSSALSEFLLFRSHLFAYATTEVRSTAGPGSRTLQMEILSALLGNSVLDNGDPISTPSVFDLFDFADLPVERQFNLPPANYFQDIASTVLGETESGNVLLYPVAKLEELIQVRKSELSATGNFRDEEQFNVEANDWKLFVYASNQSRQLQHNRFLALRSWAELITTVLTCSPFDNAGKQTFILHAIQIILPKLDHAIARESPEALELARLAETLISKLASDFSTVPASRSGDVIDEKLHHLFQVSARGIVLSSADVSLRETLYTICARYITRITSPTSTQNSAHDDLRNQCQQIVKSAGASLIDKICDDAYAGQDTCRAAALLLLDCLAVLDSLTDCILAGTIARSNSLSLFLDAVRSMPAELVNADQAETATLLPYYESLLALLQQLSGTKNGAVFVLQSGLFDSVRESQLFATDPDIGLGIQHPHSLQKYYDLLLGVGRVIVSAVFSRGIHNEQIKLQTRAFLAESRPCIVGIFKRFSQVRNDPDAKHSQALVELAKSFMALMAATDFLGVDQQQTQQAVSTTFFS